MDANFWLTLVDQAVIPLLTLVVLPILLMFLRRALDAFEAKTNLEISREQRQILEELVAKAIAFAEEQARKAIKNADAMEMGGDQKLEAALEFVKEGARALGLDLSEVDVAAMIEARLFTERRE